MNYESIRPLLLTPRLCKSRRPRQHRVFLVGFGWMIFLGMCYAMWWMCALAVTVSWDFMVLVNFSIGCAAWLLFRRFKPARVTT